MMSKPSHGAALERAVADRQPQAGLVHHSDRGLQYARPEYVATLDKYGIVASMSRPANPYDNASCESFMKTLKAREIYANRYNNLEQLADETLEEFIEEYYNRQRLHSALATDLPRNSNNKASGDASRHHALISFLEFSSWIPLASPTPPQCRQGRQRRSPCDPPTGHCHRCNLVCPPSQRLCTVMMLFRSTHYKLANSSLMIITGRPFRLGHCHHMSVYLRPIRNLRTGLPTLAKSHTKTVASSPQERITGRPAISSSASALTSPFVQTGKLVQWDDPAR